MILSAIGTAILVALSLWLFGGVLLRAGGALLILIGALSLATAGDANGLVLVAFGTALWWTGHLHLALRRGAWKSAPAARAFDGLAALWHRLSRHEDELPPEAGLRALPGAAGNDIDDRTGGR